ncbi:MAG: diadenylate cyclase CdaA [Bacteroidales bacterium]|nr:diadenylate cyclase CdaA [Prevotella sp.]MBR3466461.1 diadenylate cyclase CdaA [Bacteroidales bacterium]
MPFDFGIKDIIDVVLVALVFYYVFKMMKESRSLNIFFGIMVFVLVWLFVSQVLKMRLLGSILNVAVSFGGFVLVLLFQDEIRKFLYTIGAHQRVRGWRRFFFSAEKNARQDRQAIDPIVKACLAMSRSKVGALIVIERSTPLDDIVGTGELIDANISERLIMNLFFKNSPLHDGAMVISKKRILATGCILPLSHDLNIPKELGLRHRAAMGMSQGSDAVVVIVSEETGGISVAINGEFQLRISAEKLESILLKELSL